MRRCVGNNRVKIRIAIEELTDSVPGRTSGGGEGVFMRVTAGEASERANAFGD
jgi:hypothetical protein